MNKTTSTTRKTLKIFGITVFDLYSDTITLGIKENLFQKQDISSEDYMILEKFKAIDYLKNKPRNDDEDSTWWND